jgi:cytochrome c-type biogenesis protein
VPGSLNICDKWDKPVVVSFLFVRGAKCEPQFDRLDRVWRQYGGTVNIVGVFFERDRDRVRDIVKKNGWRFPMVVDRDGAITNLYAVGGCPTTVFADRGGKVRDTRTGDLDERELATLIGRLKR